MPKPEVSQDPPERPANPRLTPPRPRRWVLARWAFCLGLALLVIPLLVSYTRALVYPGQASIAVRSVEWLRDHGGSPLVDAAENWWYTRQAPPTTAPPLRLQVPLATGPGVPAALPALGPPPDTDVEGHWIIGPTNTSNGAPPLFETFLRPDARHPGVTAGVARFDQGLVIAHLIAGTREPDESSWPEGGQVPVHMRPRLVATFNAGFKFAAAHGGFYTDGRMAVPLREGTASLVIDRNGRVSVDQWGRDRQFGPDIAAVRQNLALIVDNGHVVPGLEINTDNRWGSAKNQLQYTWRSALGVDAEGHLYYVAGDKLTLATLARALADTGAVRGMELDIHPNEVHLFAYCHPPGAAQPEPTALFPTMRGTRHRYLRPDQRDFVALALR